MPALQYRISSNISNGYAEVLVRFYSGRAFSQRAKSRVFCPVCAWDDEKQQLTIPKKITPQTAEIAEIQHKLDCLRDYIFRKWWDEQYSARNGWLQQTIDVYMNIQNRNRSKLMTDIVDEFIAYKEPSRRMRDQYEVIKRLLQEYGDSHSPLYADKFTPTTVADLIAFYKTRPIATKNGEKHINRSVNTIASKEKMLRSICQFAVRNKDMDVSPFGKEDDGMYQPHTERYGDIVCLKESECQALMSYPFTGIYEVVRDIFIFQCHVGCRVSDLLSLTNDNVQDGFLQYIPIKTRGTSANVVRVPLDDVAFGIIEKYAGANKLLPFISDAYYNALIHKVAHEAGLYRKVITLKNGEQVVSELWQVCTSHTARRTFAQKMFRHTRSEMVTSSFTGHSPHTRVFSRYAKVDDDMKIEIMNEVENKH